MTTRVVSERDYHEIRDSISHDLLNFLNYQNITPILIPNNLDLALELVNYADILILSGGNDLITESDSGGKSRDEFLNAVHTRNDIELRLIEESRTASRPIFGICHGLQIINHYFGGSLQKIKSKHMHVANEHTTSLVADESVGWFKARELLVNSYHNYGVDKLGNNLEIIAMSEDNEIEAVSHKSERIMALMWHPERNFSDEKSYEFNKNIIRKFVDVLI